MLTSARDYALIEAIARYFDMLHNDSMEMVRRGYSSKENLARANCWKQAAEDVRSITINGVERPAPAERMEKANG